jgi:magnesium-transporting ATPase (P-type)
MQCPKCKKKLSSFKIILKELFTSWPHFCPYCQQRFDTFYSKKKSLITGSIIGILFAALLIGLDILGYSEKTQLLVGISVTVLALAISYFYIYKTILLKIYVESKADTNLKKDRLKASLVLIAGLIMVFVFFFLINYILGEDKPLDLEKYKSDIPSMKVERLVKTTEALQNLIESNNFFSTVILDLGFYCYILILIPNIFIICTGLFSQERLGQKFFAYKKIIFANIAFGLIVFTLTWFLIPEKAPDFLGPAEEIIKNQNVPELKELARKGAGLLEKELAQLESHRYLARLIGYVTILINFIGLLIVNKKTAEK